MSGFLKSVAAVAAVILVVASPALRAYWIPDGIGICTLSGAQTVPQAVSDGAGGAIIAWEDNFSGTLDIYAQRVSAAGNVVWAVNGIAICAAADVQEYVQLVSDGAGGAVLVWVDHRNGNADIYAQRVNASGSVLWGANGLAVCTAANDQSYQSVVSDGAGGIIVAWRDYRTGSSYDIYVQRVVATGVAAWTANGVAVCVATGNKNTSAITTDGAAGAIVGWGDLRSGSYDIYVQRVNGYGSAVWTANGVALCAAPGSQSQLTLAADGAGGAIAVWRDLRTGDFDVYARRVSSSGTALWTANGVPVCEADNHQSSPFGVADGAGGAVIVWQDQRQGDSYYDVYGQRLDSSGAALWAVGGIELCETSSDNFAAVSDGAGGAIATWRNTLTDGYDIMAQRVSVSGDLPWGPAGSTLCSSAGQKAWPCIAIDGMGGGIIAWRDTRALSDDIYAQLVDLKGRPGYLAPDIESVMDVPGDQGRSVFLSWYAARADLFIDSKMSHYSIWRSINQDEALLAVDGGARLIESLAELGEKDEASVIRVEEAGTLTFFWQLVGTHEALYMEGYGVPVSTLFDSSATCSDPHYFQVVAHSTVPAVFWKSPPDSGWSVDNLAPYPPAGFAGERVVAPAGLELTWDPNTESDFSCYALYRGTFADFVPGAGNLVGQLEETEYFDGEWNWGAGYYYKLSAFDVNGNESAFALFSPDNLTGVDSPDVPASTYLAQNFPNPFNPTTRIAFGLAAPARVSLRIYDAAGRLVRVLVDEARQAGAYAEIWDGRDTRGAQVASGIYFYRLTAGAFIQTRKMLLVR